MAINSSSSVHPWWVCRHITCVTA